MTTRRAASRPTAALVAAGGLAVTTAIVWSLEHGLGVPNASAVYLVVVAGVAVAAGTLPAVATALVAVVLYNLLFVEPRLTLAVSRAEDVLTLGLLLFVGVVISRLAGLQRARERDAAHREHEARALFGIAREIVRTERLADALGTVAERLVDDGGFDTVWIAFGSTPATGTDRRVVRRAGSRLDERPVASATHQLLRRDATEAGVAVGPHPRPEHALRVAGRRPRWDLSGRDRVRRDRRRIGVGHPQGWRSHRSRRRASSRRQPTRSAPRSGVSDLPRRRPMPRSRVAAMS